jgi:hypothetical protein
VGADSDEARRLAALRKCAIELNARRNGDPDLRRVCQTARVWDVSAETRTVIADSATTTFVHGICPQTLAYLAKRRQVPPFACVELLDEAGKALVRFLVRTEETIPAIRAFYSVRARILTNIPGQPESVIFNRGYFT